MHFSNWLIDIKNKASLRNEYQTSFSANWNHRGDSADMENSSKKKPNERTSELAIPNHLWKRGEYRGGNGPGGNKPIFPTQQGVLCLFVYLFLKSENALSCGNAVGLQQASSLGQRGGRRRALLPRRRSANRT